MEGFINFSNGINGNEVDNFDEAKSYVKEVLFKLDKLVTIHTDDEKTLKYYLSDKIIGILQNEKLQLINNKGEIYYDKS